MAKQKFIVYSQYVIYKENVVNAYSKAQAADIIMCRHKAKDFQEPEINSVMTVAEEVVLMAGRRRAI